jgi:hypothetical protein
MKSGKKSKISKRNHHVPLLIVAGVIAVVALGAVTVISRQKDEARVSSAPAESVATSKQQPNFIMVKVAGRDVQVDPQTGQIKQLTPQEAQELAEGLKKMLNRSTEGLVEVHESDGSVSMDLQGRFQNVTVARTNEDGSVATSCVDNPQAAANFFQIDPRLLGVDAPAQPQKPVRQKIIQ